MMRASSLCLPIFASLPIWGKAAARREDIEEAGITEEWQHGRL